MKVVLIGSGGVATSIAAALASHAAASLCGIYSRQLAHAESLRKRFETDRSVKGEILELERQEQLLGRELFDLRNKVIALENKAK